MDITDKSVIGYTFWISPQFRSLDEYQQYISYMNDQGYKLSQLGTYIISDERSIPHIDRDEVIEIDSLMISQQDSSIYSIIQSMSNRSILVITGDDEVSHSQHIKRSLAIFITRLMKNTYCTIISEHLYVVDTMKDLSWQKRLQGYVGRISDRAISTLRGVQFSKGQSITTLYRLTSYLLSCIDWNDTTISIVGAAHISETSQESLEQILSQGGSCRGEYTWKIHGYMIIRVDRLHGYTFDMPNLSVTISSLGMRSFKSYNILLDSDTKR